MANFTVALASVTKYDLTTVAVNPQAYAPSQPNRKGFTIQNRMDFDAIGTAARTATKGVANILKLVKIPPRALVNRVIFAVPPGATDVNHKYTNASGSAPSGASVGKSGYINIGYIWFKNASAYLNSTLVASSVIQDVDAVADIAITKKTGVITNASSNHQMPDTNVSHPEYGAINMYDTSSSPPDMFPYGGWLVMQLQGASPTSAYAVMTGDLHVVVECAFLPE